MSALTDVDAAFACPPLMVAIVFSVAYLLVGIPVHFTRGALARDVLGTLAGVFAALVYITWVLGFHANIHSPLR
ncbi:hypothetical protein AB3X94_38145 [Paraburkholderia sp. BR10923]|uniref:Uncharacterized protein n=1 Tax=Paraburkholderia youngii TaxID=2782701 RepID=A0A7Y6K5X8_9BURK|nr:hypothetical protein [Paraburkholderia youngii]NUY04133.1 hypothetical protein [Paraburkholderia youngii]NVH77985.1 hypothetical protein [Paraburkholderia youngii]